MYLEGAHTLAARATAAGSAAIDAGIGIEGITDGFTGNVIVKTAEGVAKLLGGFLREELRSTLQAKVGGLLAGNRRKGADAALALQAEKPLVKPAGEQHCPVQLEKERIGDSGFEGLIQLAALVQDGEVIDRVRQFDSRFRHATAVLSASGKTPWELKHIYDVVDAI